MSEMLLEFFSEEIPARMQQKAANDLARLVTDGLKAAGLEISGEVRQFATPRRLTLVIDGLAARSPDIHEEKKGPSIDAPEQALAGFMRRAGIDNLNQCEQRKEKKHTFYVAIVEKKGRKAEDVLAELIPEVIRKFPWPKSMRWGAGSLRWVRPLQSILCLFDGKTVAFDVDGIPSGNTTCGHRFMVPDTLTVNSFDDYKTKLAAAKVMIDTDERAGIILKLARELAAHEGLELVKDEGLLQETAGLVEWPVPLMGSFDEAFLDVPPEVLILSMKKHQKCFTLRDPETGKLANRFILVSNLVAEDGGKNIIAGNERVIHARLSDAKFFWEQDLRIPLNDLLSQLEQITFHEKLGTQAEHVKRIEALATELAPLVGADPKMAARAAQLCKADLVTQMVGEFADLQGLMGKYYAQKAGEPEEVATALETHYRPQGPSDVVPNEPVAITVALADKLNMLVGFWTINEKPTGSKDPYALRRAALGVIRIVLENGLRLELLNFVNDDLLAFFHERLKVYLRGQGVRHDLIDSVITPEFDDLLLIVKRIKAIGKFLETDDGMNLLAGIKRTANILRLEERKDNTRFEGAPDETLMREAAEKALYVAIQTTASDTKMALERDEFEAAMLALARLRAPVDAFFDDVTINTKDGASRANHLRLLSCIRNICEPLGLLNLATG
ncbi:MAG TPA: glycine--tRNA ligase subunit beta [Rhizobiales bacterium]|nr:glycine--tRNA ligase subunit beta [Hyphomicrobiales bacterium]